MYRKQFELSNPEPDNTSIQMNAAGDGDESFVFTLSEPAHLTHCIDNYDLTVVDVWQPGCPPCERVTPKFHDLADNVSEKYPNVAFAVLNSHTGLARVESVPTILMYEKGNPAPVAVHNGEDGFDSMAANFPKQLRTAFGRR